MSDLRDQRLDQLLRSRHVEPASTDLAQRIILEQDACRKRRMFLYGTRCGNSLRSFTCPGRVMC
jgi:hypothetical protein